MHRARARFAQDQARELGPAPALDLLEQREPFGERVVGDRRERDGRIERELGVAPDHAEEVGIARSPEAAHQGHRELDLVAVARAQEDLPQLRIQELGVLRRRLDQAVAQGVDARADVALAEALREPAARRGARIRGEGDKRVVDAFDRRPAELGVVGTAEDALERARREGDLAVREDLVVGQREAALRETFDARMHVGVDVLEDGAGLLPATEKAGPGDERTVTRVRSGA